MNFIVGVNTSQCHNDPPQTGVTVERVTVVV